MSRLPATIAAGVLAGAGVVTVVHALPAISSLAPLRNRLMPSLAGVGDPGHVALTFDDGPDPRSTPQFLRLLDERRVNATFFLLGRMLAKAPDLGRELVAAGHEVALHGWDHRCLAVRGWRATRDDLARAHGLIGEVTGTPPRWYRPPYGVLTTFAQAAAARLDMRTVLWTAWGRDWTARATPGSVHSTVLRDLRGGGTILLHDSDCTSKPDAWRSTLGALPALLDAIAERGLRVGPLREHGMAAHRGTTVAVSP